MKVSEILSLALESHNFLFATYLLIIFTGCRYHDDLPLKKIPPTRQKSSRQLIKKLEIKGSVGGQVYWTLSAEKAQKSSQNTLTYHINQVTIRWKENSYQIKAEKGTILDSGFELYKNQIHFPPYLLKTEVLRYQSANQSWTSPAFQLFHPYFSQSGQQLIWQPQDKKFKFQKGKVKFIY